MGIITDQEIEITCSTCGYIQPILLEDAMKEKSIICGGCKKNIKIKFQGDDPTKIEGELNKLANSLPKKIDIKIKL